MENLKDLEKQYYEARDAMDWQSMAAIMRKVYPEHDVTPQPRRKAKIKPLLAACRLNE